MLQLTQTRRRTCRHYPRCWSTITVLVVSAQHALSGGFLPACLNLTPPTAISSFIPAAHTCLLYITEAHCTFGPHKQFDGMHGRRRWHSRSGPRTSWPQSSVRRPDIRCKSPRAPLKFETSHLSKAHPRALPRTPRWISKAHIVRLPGGGPLRAAHACGGKSLSLVTPVVPAPFPRSKSVHASLRRE